MLKEMKPGRDYFIINIDEPYAEEIFKILKQGQIEKDQWPEGNISFEEWKESTFGRKNEILIPAGNYIKNDKSIYVDSFYIDKFPVTNKQYCNFLNEKQPIKNALNVWLYVKTGFQKEKDKYIIKDKEKENHPVINVTWYGAVAYAKHYNKRLPTIQEWEKAAMGSTGVRFPWGDSWNENASNTLYNMIESTTEVDKFINGISPFGIYDMNGNVWEWTESEGEYPCKDKRYVIKGGSWRRMSVMSDDINYMFIDIGCDDLGFRCVRDFK